MVRWKRNYCCRIGAWQRRAFVAETMAVLKSGGKVILRTAVHPTVKELERSGIKFTSCDAVYEQEASFEDVYQKIVASILQDAKEQEVVYAVPGSPLVAERTVVLLREQAAAAGVPLKILPAMSFWILHMSI